MKLILLADVKGTGKAGQVVDVSDGYARNFLLPKKLAREANSGNVAAARQSEAAQLHRRQVEREEALALARSLDGSEITLSARCGENGKLFGAITSKEIAAELSKKIGSEIDKKKVELHDTIKLLGDYEITVRVYADTTCRITARVVAE